ncbi:CDC73-domain-containing protein [Leucogyrophana mollusca]|uniref:CDC73-domain-containing protein n=1 Tax=Leucogyrophana mollusca TaxID=85980 RepID=A0ACB8B2B8_9AGAM|nr:CDC73-domain-containing protein [Leucogyrophana mollusca]
MSTTDALLALRNAIKSNAPITYAPTPDSLATATDLVLGPSLSLPKSTPTRYTKPGSPTECYSLEAVYLAWLLRDAQGAEYVKQARELGLAVGFVSVTERKTVVEWLEGRALDQTQGGRILPLEAESTTPPGTPPPSTAALASTPSAATPKHTHAPAADSPTKRRYVADPQDVEVVKRIRENEVELRDRNTVLRGTKANNFSPLRTAYAEKLKKLKEVQGQKGQAVVPAPSAGLGLMQARKAKSTSPIIIISSSPTALITMHNVKRFLQESVFEPSAAARARSGAQGGGRGEDLVTVDRALSSSHSSSSSSSHPSAGGSGGGSGTGGGSGGGSGGPRQRYFIIDSTEALAKFGGADDAWERVVCVMTTGQAWQFRPYKWAEPRVLFHHVKGIYVSWTNDPPNTKIKDWNVTELKIDPHRRHVDKSVVAHFWKILDDWTAANKPWLMK